MFRARVLLIGLILITCAGCFGPVTDVSNVDLIVKQNTSDPNMTGAPDGFPRVETTDSHIIVTDQIDGITDPSCREITANATTREGSPALVLTIQSNVSVMKDSCGTTTALSYRANVTIAGKFPDSIRVRHIYKGELIDEWTIMMNGYP